MRVTVGVMMDVWVELVIGRGNPPSACPSHSPCTHGSQVIVMRHSPLRPIHPYVLVRNDLVRPAGFPTRHGGLRPLLTVSLGSTCGARQPCRDWGRMLLLLGEHRQWLSGCRDSSSRQPT